MKTTFNQATPHLYVRGIILFFVVVISAVSPVNADSTWFAKAVLVLDSGLEVPWCETSEEPLDSSNSDEATKIVADIFEERIKQHKGSPKIKAGSLEVEFYVISQQGVKQSSSGGSYRLQLHLSAREAVKIERPDLQLTVITLNTVIDHYDSFDLTLSVRNGMTTNNLYGRSSIDFASNVPQLNRGVFDIWKGDLLPSEERRIEVEVTGKAPWNKPAVNSPIPDESLGKFAVKIKFDDRGRLVPTVEYLENARNFQGESIGRRAAEPVNQIGQRFELVGGKPQFVAYLRVIQSSSDHHKVARAEKDADFALKLLSKSEVQAYRASVAYRANGSTHGFGFFVFVSGDHSAAKKFARELLPKTDESCFVFVSNAEELDGVAEKEFARRLNSERAKLQIDDSSIQKNLVPMAGASTMERIGARK